MLAYNITFGIYKQIKFGPHKQIPRNKSHTHMYMDIKMGRRRSTDRVVPNHLDAFIIYILQ